MASLADAGIAIPTFCLPFTPSLSLSRPLPSARRLPVLSTSRPAPVCMLRESGVYRLEVLSQSLLDREHIVHGAVIPVCSCATKIPADTSMHTFTGVLGQCPKYGNKAQHKQVSYDITGPHFPKARCCICRMARRGTITWTCMGHHAMEDMPAGPQKICNSAMIDCSLPCRGADSIPGLVS